MAPGWAQCAHACAGRPRPRGTRAAGTFHFITAVWEAEYTDLFLTATLPNELSAGNLGACATRPDRIVFKIYTTARDAETIRGASVFKKLQSLVETKVVTFERIDSRAKYD